MLMSKILFKSELSLQLTERFSEYEKTIQCLINMSETGESISMHLDNKFQNVDIHSCDFISLFPPLQEGAIANAAAGWVAFL